MRPTHRPVAAGGALLSAVVIGLNPGPAVAGLADDGAVLALVFATWLVARDQTYRTSS